MIFLIPLYYQKHKFKIMLSINDNQLVILDFQGKLSQIVYQSETVLSKASALIKGIRHLEIPITWVEQTPEKLGQTTPEIAECLSGLSPMAKCTFSAYATEEIAQKIQSHQRKQVLLIGIETHICIWQTTEDLIQAGYEVFVPCDAVSSRTLENKQIGLQMIEQAQGRLTCVEGALFSLLRTAKHEKFRDIAKLIK